MSVPCTRIITPPATMVVEQPGFRLRLSMKPTAPTPVAPELGAPR